jgi:hypothetical protein
MSVVDSPEQRPTTGSTGSGESHGASLVGSLRQAPRSPVVVAVVVCTVLGALSAAILPTVPSYDPWSWIVWGREATDPHLSFIIGGGSSWKPLPVIFTTIWGLFGSAAPTLWVITARIGGLLGLWGTWKLAARLVGGGWRGAIAGALAVAGIILTQDWVYYFLRGTSEVILIATTVWFVDRLLDGRRTQAFLIGAVGGLIRPEWWPFLLVYAAWLVWRDPRFRRPGHLVILAAGLIAQPFFWFVPPYITTGHAFSAATQAAQYNGHLGANVLRTVVARGVNDQVLPALILAIVAVIVAWIRDRNRVILGIGAGIAAWWVVVVAETLDGYPGLERFFLPGAALTCVLAGVGVALLAQLAGELAGRAGGRATAVAGILTAAVLIALWLPFGTTRTRISEARAFFPAASRAVSTFHELDRVIAAAGGRQAILPCKSSFVAINHSVQSAMAWKLHVTLERVGTRMTQPGLDFIGPHNSVDGGPARVDPRLTRHETVAAVDHWRVVRLTTPGLPTACDGR